MDLFNKKRYLLGLGVGVASLGFLYGWSVYADEIQKDVDTIAQQISTANNSKLPLDDSAKALEISVATSIEQQQNNGIAAGMYSVGPLAGDPNANRAADIFKNHFGGYCMLGVEGATCPMDALLQNGDAKVSTLLSGTIMDAQRQAAANAFQFVLFPISTKNLAPFAPGGVTSIANFSAQNNPNSSTYPDPVQSFADNLTNQALLSIARQPFTEMVAKRTAPQSGGDSMMQMMDRVASQRFLSSSWASSLNPPAPAGTTPSLTALATQTNVMLQEIALMQAYHVWLDYERYRQMERVEALLSAMVIQNYNSGQAVSAQLSNQPSAAPAPASTSSTSAPAAPSPSS